MSAIPGVPAQLRPLLRAASTTLRQAQTSAALAPGARVADLDAAASAAFAADPDLFCSDRFHPSSAGYALIAHALTPTMLAAAKDVLGDLRCADRAHDVPPAALPVAVAAERAAHAHPAVASTGATMPLTPLISPVPARYASIRSATQPLKRSLGPR